jgi:hypothetical protein
MANGVLKVRVGGSWLPVATAAGGPHHATHETGGNDQIVSISAAILTSGTVPDARFPATLPAVSGANLTNLNATSLATGLVADARLSANVLKVTGGFPGGTATFLRADGTFAVAGTGDVLGPTSAVTSNVATFASTSGKIIQDSGLAVSNIPRLNAANSFHGQQTAQSFVAQAAGAGAASLMLFQTDAAAGNKWWQFYTANGTLVFRSLADDWSAQYGFLTLDHAGNLQTSMEVIARGLLETGAPDGSWPGIKFYNTYLTIVNKDTAQIAWFHETGILNLTAGNLRFSSTLFSLQNASGTPVLTVRSDGVVTVPYFLVVPVGTDKWAPA